MSERKQLATIEFIVDTDREYEFLGEVDGGFNQEALEQYISKYGINDLSKHLSYLQFQMFETYRNLNTKQENNQTANKLKED